MHRFYFFRSDPRNGTFPECMQAQDLVLWCNFSNHTKVPDPDKIKADCSFRNSVALYLNDSCIRTLTKGQIASFLMSTTDSGSLVYYFWRCQKYLWISLQKLLILFKLHDRLFAHFHLVLLNTEILPARYRLLRKMKIAVEIDEISQIFICVSSPCDLRSVVGKFAIRNFVSTNSILIR